MSKMASRLQPEKPKGERVPPLRDGDRLSREEFERRWNAMPDLKRAELIEGIVYMPSPVDDEEHGRPHFSLGGWLYIYSAATPGVVGGCESSIRLDQKNMPQPDDYLRILPECGGQAKRSADGLLAGAPELAAEVAASSASRDLHAKKEVYRRNGVFEYLVWRVRDQKIEWFELVAGQYVAMPADSNGIYKSKVFPGLWLDAAALIRGDAARVNQVLLQGMGSPEHAVFIERLAKVAPPGR